MTLHSRMCSLTTMITRPAVVRRHLTGVEGLEHIPLDTPFVLISNHISFADHFIYETLLFATRGAQGAFLTKAESFSGLRGIWFDSMGAVPVDRDNPVKGLLATADRILGNGRVLVVYPEGTRNREPEEMLPFKDGAFRFAERAGVPVVPAALWGTQDILPIGARAPRSGTARVVFGPPLYGNVDLPRAARLRDLTERGKAAVSGLLDQARTPEPARSAAASQQTSALADAVLERSLSGIDPVPTAIRHQQAHLLLGLARGTDRENIAARLGAVRLLGLRAMESRSPVSPAKLVRLFRVRSGATRILRKDPDQLMAHYLLGRWHLAVPRLLGGRAERAVHHLAATERLGRGDSRFGMAHAEALLAAGRTGDAAAALDRVIAAPAPDLRTRRRRERAAQMLHRVAPAAALRDIA